jgi:hypothetical protein
MGVDFLVCRNCGDTFPDCGYCVWCECGEHWCSDSCAEADGYEYKEYEDDDGGIIEELTCSYCRKEDFDNNVLLEFALKKLGIDRNELVNLYKKTL